MPGTVAASAVGIDDTGHLHLLKAFGSVLLEEGYAGGTLPGQAQVRLVVKSSVSATFSIAARGGTIHGGGRAALHSSGRYSSFGGSLWVSGGSGRYAHARGGGKLYGTIDRRTHAVVVQAIGRLTY
ncbi:MAG: autotransporter [Solirubrobacteraceae bacterium]